MEKELWQSIATYLLCESMRVYVRMFVQLYLTFSLYTILYFGINGGSTTHSMWLVRTVAEKGGGIRASMRHTLLP